MCWYAATTGKRGRAALHLVSALSFPAQIGRLWLQTAARRNLLHAMRDIYCLQPNGIRSKWRIAVVDVFIWHGV